MPKKTLRPRCPTCKRDSTPGADARHWRCEPCDYDFLPRKTPRIKPRNNVSCTHSACKKRLSADPEHEHQAHIAKCNVSLCRERGEEHPGPHYIAWDVYKEVEDEEDDGRTSPPVVDTTGYDRPFVPGASRPKGLNGQIAYARRKRREIVHREGQAFTLRELRIERALSTKRLAQRVGCAELTIWRIETGIRGASFDMILRICEVLRVQPNEVHEFQKIIARRQASVYED